MKGFLKPTFELRRPLTGVHHGHNGHGQVGSHGVHVDVAKEGEKGERVSDAPSFCKVVRADEELGTLSEVKLDLVNFWASTEGLLGCLRVSSGLFPAWTRC